MEAAFGNEKIILTNKSILALWSLQKSFPLQNLELYLTLGIAILKHSSVYLFSSVSSWHPRKSAMIPNIYDLFACFSIVTPLRYKQIKLVPQKCSALSRHLWAIWFKVGTGFKIDMRASDLLRTDELGATLLIQIPLEPSELCFGNTHLLQEAALLDPVPAPLVCNRNLLIKSPENWMVALQGLQQGNPLGSAPPSST